MRKSVQTVILVLSLAMPAGALGKTIKKLDLEDGREEDNRIERPIYDAEEVGPVTFAEIDWPYDSSRLVGYYMWKKLAGEDPQRPKKGFRFHDSIDLGALFTEALRAESSAMGLAEGAGDGWRVSGVLNDFAVEWANSGGGFGPILCYGYLDISLEARDPAGELHSVDYLIHTFSQGGCFQRCIVEAAQEVVARLNRDLLHAPPHPSIIARLEGLTANEENQEHDLLMIGLSGATDAVPRLLELLEAEKDEADRVNIINALALLGTDPVFEPLARRYAAEDEDCRLLILKAMGYLDTPPAREFVTTHGREDRNLACRVWSTHIDSRTPNP